MKRFSFIIAILAAFLLAGSAFAAGTTTTTPVDGKYNVYQPGHNGNGGIVTATYALPTTATAGDIVQMVRLPANVIVTDIALASADVDSGTSITMSVGYGTNDDYFLVASTVGQAGGVARAAAATALPLTLAASDTIDVKVVATAGTAVAGNIALTVFYTEAP